MRKTSATPGFLTPLCELFGLPYSKAHQAMTPHMRGICQGPVVRLGVIDGLFVLSGYITGATIHVAETFDGVGALSDRLGKHVRHARQWWKNLHRAVGRLVIVIHRKDVFVPIRLPVGGVGHGAGVRARVIKRFRERGGAAVERLNVG